MSIRYLAIVNPGSGQGKSFRCVETVVDSFRRKGIELDVRKTTHRGHAEEMLRKGSLDGFDAVLSVGGDGTLHEIVNGLLTRKDDAKLPIGVIPSGTGNSLMKDCHCSSVEDGIEQILKGKTIPIDVFQVSFDDHVRYGINMVGCGLPAVVNDYAEAHRNFRNQRYNVGALLAILKHKPYGLKISGTDLGEGFSSDFILASNTQYIGSGIKIAPDALLDDGLLDLFVLKPIRRKAMLSLFIKLMKATHMNDPSVRHLQLGRFSVIAEKESLLNIDGEQFLFSKLEVSVLPCEIDLFV